MAGGFDCESLVRVVGASEAIVKVVVPRWIDAWLSVLWHRTFLASLIWRIIF